MGSSPVSRGSSRVDFNEGDEFEDAGPEPLPMAHVPAHSEHEASVSSESLEVSPENLADMLESLAPGHEGVVDSEGKHQPGFQVPNNVLDRRSGELKLKHP